MIIPHTIIGHSRLRVFSQLFSSYKDFTTSGYCGLRKVYLQYLFFTSIHWASTYIAQCIEDM